MYSKYFIVVCFNNYNIVKRNIVSNYGVLFFKGNLTRHMKMHERRVAEREYV